MHRLIGDTGKPEKVVLRSVNRINSAAALLVNSPIALQSSVQAVLRFDGTRIDCQNSASHKIKRRIHSLSPENVSNRGRKIHVSKFHQRLSRD